MKKRDVIEHFKGVSATAKALGVTHVAVSRWGDVLPEGRAYKAQVITEGKLKVNPKDYERNNEKIN